MIKLVVLIVYCKLLRAIMKETKPSDVLLLPELLEKILSYCYHSSSFNSLLKLRRVCSVWKDCIFSVIVKNVPNIPSIHSDTTSFSYPSYHRHLHRVLQEFFKSVSPSCSLPFRIYLNHSVWCAELETVFKDYSKCIVHLQINDFLFEKALQLTDFPKLRRVELIHWNYEGVTSSTLIQDYFQTKACHLAELILDVDANIQLGAMNNLKILKLVGASSLSASDSIAGDSQSLAKLLPNLTEVSFGIRNGVFDRAYGLGSMAANEAVFKNVISLEIHEAWDRCSIYEEEDCRPEELIVKCFPNVSKLEWATIEPICHRMSSSNPFSGLQHLTSLTFVSLNTCTGHEVFQFLTGVTVDEIPVREGQWGAALVDNDKAFSNLKNLKSLYLKHKKHIHPNPAVRKDLTRKQSRFLLKAVFQKMEALQKITLVNIPFNPRCIRQWEKSGREFHRLEVEVEEKDRYDIFAKDNNDYDWENESWFW